MRRFLLAAALLVVAACASNRNEEAGARIEDTTITAGDTLNPNDTLPRIRDSVMDSAQ
jgi:predicted component of type VI protein secretion system